MKTTQTICLAVVVMLAVGINASAGLIDLTVTNDSGTVNGATFTQSDMDRSTGTGVFDPFVRIEKPQGQAGIEAGYNTDGITEFETKDDNRWTHSIQIQDIPVVDGKYEFRLDFNQNNNATGRYLSLDELKIHVVPFNVGGSLSGYPNTDLLSFGPADWDLGDNWIALNFTLEPGSGAGDMIALIPLTNVNPTDYVYLYSKFGMSTYTGVLNSAPDGYADGVWTANDGFEEWGVIPEPATMLLLALGSILMRKRR
jgi:hypothetical protein